MSSESSAPAEGKLRLKLVKSPIGYSQRQKDTVRALGLRRMNQVVEHQDTPTIRGMVARVNHLVRILDSEEQG